MTASDLKETNTADQSADQSRLRDAATLKVLGAFFAIMGLLVFVSIFYVIGDPPAAIVTVASAAVLCGIGGGMIWAGRRLSRRGNQPLE